MLCLLNKIHFSDFDLRSSWIPTGPVKRVPRGFLSVRDPTRMQELSPKEIFRPFVRRIGCFVRTTRAMWIAFFLTRLLGRTCRRETVIRSPIEAVFDRDLFKIRRHRARRAPELSATCRLDWTWIIEWSVPSGGRKSFCVPIIWMPYDTIVTYGRYFAKGRSFTGTAAAVCTFGMIEMFVFCATSCRIIHS